MNQDRIEDPEQVRVSGRSDDFQNDRVICAVGKGWRAVGGVAQLGRVASGNLTAIDYVVYDQG